jgi:hypothetical protein
MDQLEAVLKRIDDGKKRQREDIAVATLMPAPTHVDVPLFFKYYDASTKRHYYFCPKTQLSQWDEPSADCKVVDMTPPGAESGDAPCSSSSSSARYVDPLDRAVDQLLANSVLTQPSSSYERDLRQMSAFMDLNEFEQNRAKSKKVKEDLQAAHIDWREVKAAKKDQKKQRELAKWLDDLK